MIRKPAVQTSHLARKPGASADAASALAGQGTYARIYRMVARIPRGRVATYGQIARLAGMPRAARQVGYALAALRDDAGGVPWQRVVNARGEISARFEPAFEGLQRAMLEQEGVRFDAASRISLERFQWQPAAEPRPRERTVARASVRKRKRKRPAGD